MTADPRGFGATSHWSHHRAPANAEEQAEVDAQLFQADESAERAIVVLERYPGLAGELLRHAAAAATPGSDYLTRRRATAAVHGWHPDPRIARDVDEAARALAALAAPPVADDAAHRERFAAASVLGSHGDQAVEFDAWLAARASSHSYRVRLADLRARLMLTHSERPARLAPPSFAVEVDRAWNAHASELHRRAADPSPAPVEATRRVPPALPDDSASAELEATDPATAATGNGSPASPEAIRPADRDGSAAAKSDGSPARRPRTAP